MKNLFENSGANFSKDGLHRYSLWRIWNKSLPLVMFIGLNPSTANGIDDDPTIRSVIRIAKRNGFGGVYMMNCWTYISTDPKGLLMSEYADAINRQNLREIADQCTEIVFAWGNFDVVKKHGRDQELIAMFPNAKALQLNKNGSPKHPLYCKTDSVLVPFK